jgi:hypothetical protein
MKLHNRIAVFVFIAAVSSLTFCNTPEIKSSPKQLLELTASLGGTGRFLDSINVIYIAATVYNPGNDTVDFVTMRCSYEDMFTTNTDSFKVQSRYDCFSNYPVVVMLPPKARTDRYLMIRRAGNNNWLDTGKLKLGMYLALPKKGDDFQDIINLYEQRQKAEVLWSNELDLKRFYKTIY